MEKAREVKAIAGARLTNTALEAVEDAEALVIATEWPEFANIDLATCGRKCTPRSSSTGAIFSIRKRCGSSASSTPRSAGPQGKPA